MKVTINRSFLSLNVIRLKTANMPKVSTRETKRAKEIVNVKDEGSVMLTSSVHYSAKFAPGRFVVYSRFNDRDWAHIREYLRAYLEQLRHQQEAITAASNAT